jgi:hypothetical protein
MYRSNLRQTIHKLHHGIDMALVAAVTIPFEATKADLAKGFTSGDYTSGESAASVKRSEVRGDYAFGRYVRYGTSLFYHRFWTFGGMNAFTGQFERVDKWSPHFYENQPRMLAAAQAALKAALR